jgi:hypothetical protein
MVSVWSTNHVNTDTGGESPGTDASRHGLSTMMEHLDGCHRSDIGISGRGSVLCLLSKPVAESVIAEEAHDANFAVETL